MAKKSSATKKAAPKKAAPKKAAPKKAAPKKEEPEPEPEFSLRDFILENLMSGSANGYFRLASVQGLRPETTIEEVLEVARHRSRSQSDDCFVLL